MSFLSTSSVVKVVQAVPTDSILANLRVADGEVFGLSRELHDESPKSNRLRAVWSSEVGIPASKGAAFAAD